MERETTEEKLNAILGADELSNSAREALFSSFFILNALELARKLYGLDIPDSVRAQMIALKVSAPTPSKDDGMERVISNAAERFWNRLGAEK
jgi:hypothetical protein